MNADGQRLIGGIELAAADRVATDVVSPGSTLTGDERRALAQRSRATMEAVSAGSPDESTPTDPVTGEPTRWLVDRLTVAAHTVRPGHISELTELGVSATTIVEILSLVARLQAIDTFCFGVGSEPAPLPQALDGPPTGVASPEARIQGGWLPTVGPASPPNALSLIPDEHDAMHELHEALYLSVKAMADLDADRGLHRTQMELVAARTSLINECFF